MNKLQVAKILFFTGLFMLVSSLVFFILTKGSPVWAINVALNAYTVYSARRSIKTYRLYEQFKRPAILEA